jgi:hypothetical protein
MRDVIVRSILLAVAAAMIQPTVVLAQPLEELPLERGFYVRTDETCKTATNAGTALLRRAGLQWVTSHCIFDRIEQTTPTTYLVTQSCGDTNYSDKANATYEIPDRASFSFTDDNGWEHAARLCAQRDMPQPWRDLDISDMID